VPTNPSIAYYITSHGYGHGVRSGSIIGALHELNPRLTVQIISELPASFIWNMAGSAGNPVRAKSFDVGMVQLDSIRVDVGATLDRLEDLHSERGRLVDEECAYLREMGIAIVVADIPGIPLEAAAHAGIPRIAIGNFGWDWIYSGFVPQDACWSPMVEMYREQYAMADLLLRLPFCEAMTAFPNIEDIPLVAREGRSRRREIAALTGCDMSKKWILLSFTSLDWSEDAVRHVEEIDEYEFLTVLPLQWKRKNIYAISREQFPFSDVIASADAVITKPGFGILSDCIINRKPIIYADRSDFLEYAILEDGIRKYLRHVHIPMAKLYGGDLRESLEEIWNRPEPGVKLPSGGDRIAAARITALAGI
jgi:hypothetical protein